MNLSGFNKILAATFNKKDPVALQFIYPVLLLAKTVSLSSK
jgi:hypothetical protein